MCKLTSSKEIAFSGMLEALSKINVFCSTMLIHSKVKVSKWNCTGDMQGRLMNRPYLLSRRALLHAIRSNGMIKAKSESRSRIPEAMPLNIQQYATKQTFNYS